MNDSDISQEFSKQACLLLSQSLEKIEHCLGQIDQSQCWWRPAKGLNSIGNLLLHINGNLRQWAICGITGAADERNRPAEFSREGDIDIEALRQLTCQTVEEAMSIIRGVKADKLLESTTIQAFEVTIMQAILHTAAHFQGHTHQIIMLTRIQLGDKYQFQWTPQQPRGELPM